MEGLHVTVILVTGGAGFVGSRLAMGIKSARPEARVVALDNLRRRGSELNVPRLASAGVEFRHGDVRDTADLAAVGAIDCLLECSAEPSVLAGYGESPRYVLDTNLLGAINCLEVARRHGAGFVFLSTSRVYPIEPLRRLRYAEGPTRFELAAAQETAGVSAEGIREDFPLAGARSMYGASKLSAELLLTEYQAMYGLPAVVNRCGVLTGPWQMGKVDQGVVVLWAARHAYGGSLKYIGFGGSGKQVRDLLHVDDLLDLVLYQMDHLESLSGRVFNVGGGRAMSTSLLELSTLCAELTGNTLAVTPEPDTREADIPVYITDNARVTEATGWRPRRGVEKTLDDICRWLHDHEPELRPVLGG